jgi:pyruvate-ferredoxin/flavodoxin oxidoreductase
MSLETAALNLEGKNPFQLDSKAPSIPLKDYIYQEARYTILARTNPEAAAQLLGEAQEDVQRRWRVYESRAAMPGRGVGNGKRLENASQEPEMVAAREPKGGTN